MNEIKSILIIEDLNFALNELKRLNVDGYQVINRPTVKSAGKAARLIRDLKDIDGVTPDIILLDLTLDEGYDGLHVVRFVLNNFPEIEIFSTSGRTRRHQKSIYRDAQIFEVKHFPGKDPEMVEKCLTSQCDCSSL
ncbi:hypothetical protein MYX06_03755 [Patescibacteria group bacterium AH-259-L05]|nr:hypothetical protein [Patescibacteria group bacterium AH-259-L05]